MRCLSALRQINSEVSSSSQSKLTRKRIHGLVGSLAPCLSGTGLAKLLGPYSPDSTKTKDMPKLDLQLFEELKVRLMRNLSCSISLLFKSGYVSFRLDQISERCVVVESLLHFQRTLISLKMFYLSMQKEAS